MHQIHPIAQYLIALAMTVAAYGGYVSWLAPQIEGAPPVIHGIAASDHKLPEDDRAAKELSAWLPADSWELGTCKTLRTEDTTLYFRDYVTLEDGAVQIYPLTIVIAQGQGQDQEKQPPIIIRAAEQALLRFDRPFQLAGEGPGRLLSARMPGPVDIVQPGNTEGNEGLAVRTSNLQLTPQRVFTIDRVEFSHSGSFGSGRNLVMDLAHSTPPGAISTGFTTVTGLSRMELAFVDFLELASEPVGSAKPGGPAEKGALQRARVTCEGPLVFDFKDQVATFSKNVAVRSTDGSGDVLAGDKLQVVFVQEADRSTTNNVAQNVPRPGVPKLKPDRIIAVGQPARLVMPSRDASAAGEQLEYDMGLQKIRAIDSRAVVVRQAGQEFITRNLEYRIREDGSLGPMIAVGPGKLVSSGAASAGADKTQSWEVTFDEQLTIQPQTDGRLVTVSGNANVRIDQSQQIGGQQIRLWLAQTQIPSPTSGSPQWDYQPTRMEVDGNVTIGLAELQGITRKLIAIWKELPAYAAGNPVRVGSVRPKKQNEWTVASNLPTQPAIRQVVFRPALDDRAFVKTPTSKTDFDCELVTIHLNRNGKETTIEIVEMKDNVVVRQVPITNTMRVESEPTFVMTGDELKLTPTGNEQWRAHVAGSARIDSPQLALEGENLQLDQASNRIWVEGPGKMNLKQTKPKTGRDNQPAASGLAVGMSASVESLVTTWQGGMIFDGNQVWFEQQVRSNAKQPAKNGNSSDIRSVSQGLTVILDRQIDLRAGVEKQDDSSAEVRSLIMIDSLGPDQQVFGVPKGGNGSEKPGSVVLEKIERDSADKQVGRQLLMVHRIEMDVASGDIRAQGPGGIVHWQPAGSGGTQSPFGKPAAAKAEGGKSEKISCLHVNFDREMLANSQKGELNIDGNVRAVFADVDSWESQPSPDGDPPPAGATRLVCQHVKLVQWKPAGSDTQMTNMIATGDAVVQSDSFEARGIRISYDQQTEMLVLEGDARTDANLWHSSRPGSPRDNLVAGKILYNMNDGSTQIEKVRSATMNRSGKLITSGRHRKSMALNTELRFYGTRQAQNAKFRNRSTGTLQIFQSCLGVIGAAKHHVAYHAPCNFT